jgi:hypothetical protein
MKNEAVQTHAVSDIAYEIEMLLDLYTLLWEPKRGAANRMFNNCAIEATAIHVRNLLDFYEKSRTGVLGAKSPDKDDV